MIQSRKFLVTLLLVLACSFTIGREQDPELRQFDETEMSTYVGNEDFKYMNLTVQPPSIWQRLQWWFASMISKIFSNPNTPWLSNVLFYIILIAVLALAIFYMIRLKYGSVVSSDSRYFTPTNSGSSLETEKLDFDTLIKSAVEEKQFKLAIRYLYLQTLSFLAKNDLINLKDWKSPYDYVKELDNNIVPSYLDLARLFEHAWYGDFKVDMNEFEEGRELVTRIEEQLV